jgi:hypothetical protein
MVSLRFPFSFSQPPKLPNPTSTSRRVSSAAFVAASAAASAAAIAAVSLDPKHPFLQKALNRAFSPLWGSLSLADNSSSMVVESKTGVEFPSVLGDSLGLLGIGLRKKSVLGLKNIDVYAFGTTFLVQVPICHWLFTVAS